MCGIGGFFDLREGREPPPALLSAMGAALARRGPDGTRVESAPGGALVHARLAIVDRDGGTQPFAAGAGGCVLGVVGGEIYNHAALRERLSKRGAHFASSCDSEAAPHAWALGGLEGLAELEGEFALAVWDRAAGRLVLAVDPFRTKPLFWTVRDGWLVFASDVRALLSRPVRDEDLDWPAIRAYLSWGCVPGGAPPLKGVHALRPGQALVFQRGRAEPESRELFPLPPLEEIKGSDPFTVDAGKRGLTPLFSMTPEALRERLVSSVAARLQGDRLPGVWLSGGIDSGLLAVLARRAAGVEVEAFTLGVEGPDYDERPLARLSAAAAGVRHHEALLAFRSLGDLLPAFEACDAPLADTAIHTTLALSRMTAAHSRAVLSGEGADELFGGYREYRAEGLARAVPPRLLAAAAAVAGWLPSGDDRLSPGDIARRFAAGALDNAAPHAWRWRRCLGDSEIDGVFRPGSFGSGAPPAFRAGPDPGATDLATYLPDVLLPKADRVGLSSGVEVRVPYLDAGVVALARRGGFAPGKKLLRAACEGLLPKEVVHGKKRGFSAPVRAWLRADSARAEAREYILGSGARLAPQLCPETLDRWLSEHGARRRDRSREVHALLALESWLRRVS